MVGIIIVTYNSRKDIDPCLLSVFRSTYKNIKLILLDNNSADDTANFVEKKFPKVKIIRSKKNLGFAAGNNVGIKKALSSGCRYILLLNPDTIIDKNCLQRLMDKTDNRTVLQPLILIHDGKKKTQLVNTTGGVVNFLGFSYCGDYKKNAKSFNKDKEITVASGAAMFLPSKMIDKIGLFDDNFFMYIEDVDLSYRARLEGYQIKLIPQALVWHKYEFSKNKQKFYHFEKNRLLFLLRNFSDRYLFLIFLPWVVTEILMLIYALSTGWFLLKIKSYFTTIKLISKEVKIRNKNLKNINKNEKNIKKYITSDIIFSEITSPFFTPYNLILRFYWKLIYLLV